MHQAAIELLIFNGYTSISHDIHHNMKKELGKNELCDINFSLTFCTTDVSIQYNIQE